MVVLSLVLAGCTSEGQDAATTGPTTSSIAATTSQPSTVTTGTIPEPSCSSDGVPQPSRATGLPQPVSATREAIIAAAATCDLTGLESLAGEDFVTSFAGGGAENLRRWEEEDVDEGLFAGQPGRGPLGTLLLLLDMPFGTIEDGGTGDIYAWPAAFTYESWEDIPPEHLNELKAIYTEEDLALLAEYGSYIGWRTGIDEDGEWLYFVAED